MALADTYRRRLRDRALDQYGYVTTRDAADVGVPAVELRKIAQRGGELDLDKRAASPGSTTFPARAETSTWRPSCGSVPMPT